MVLAASVVGDPGALPLDLARDVSTEDDEEAHPARRYRGRTSSRGMHSPRSNSATASANALRSSASSSGDISSQACSSDCVGALTTSNLPEFAPHVGDAQERIELGQAQGGVLLGPYGGSATYSFE